MNKTDPAIHQLLREGTVIPAHPLVLHPDKKIDEPRMRALTRYYMAAGAGGVAAAVHTTQFEIRKPEIGYLEPVLKLVAEEISNARLTRPFLKVAGICGPTAAAVHEAELAAKHGYHFGLLSMGGLNDLSEAELIKRAVAVSAVIPLFGFYLQPAVGGRYLSYDFWKDFADIPNVHAIKVAAFNRYQTLDVVRAVCDSSRRNDIALYTGNDDNIVADLLTPYKLMTANGMVEKRFVGGLLGHWAVWTKKSVELFAEIKECINNNYKGAAGLLAKGIAVTDMNAAIFDAKNSFHGCIAGIHEVLLRQGLMQNLVCLNPAEKLSSGQASEIDRVAHQHHALTDDDFVKAFLAGDRK